MGRYLLRRIVSLAPTLVIVSLLIFTLIHLIPGDPARVMLGDRATEQDVERLREELGFDRPLYIQYINWVKGIFRGDFGRSVFIRESMVDIIGSHMAPTIVLTFYALLIAVAAAIPLGIIAAGRHNEAAGNLIEIFAMAGVSIPSFLLGLLMIIVFAVKLRWFPAAGYKTIDEVGFWPHLRYMHMPAAALGCMQAGFLIRMTRASVLEVLSSDYIRLVHAKGLDDFRIIFKHVLRNALIPIVTTLGQSLMLLLSGAAVVESVFNIPGIGQLIIHAVARRDYEIIQAVVLLATIINVAVGLTVDVLYAIIDPRVRLE
ncbi:MAG: ABC transporter permease [Synergistaceae bacterium]|jgi:peptide/nickel transport system permease protein|nr:ABC transporter permease [Synergistaceae bacterium]